MKPSIKTLSAVFSDPKTARKILCMTREELEATEVGAKRLRECFNPPETYDLRLHALNSIESCLRGVKSMRSNRGEYAVF